MRKLFYTLLLMIAIAPTAPAWADNEQYRLEMPTSAQAGDTIAIRGSCAGDGAPKISSDAFANGEATLRGEYRFSGSAQIVDQPGEYKISHRCGATKLGTWTFTVL
jgi:hypothetical protein